MRFRAPTRRHIREDDPRPWTLERSRDTPETGIAQNEMQGCVQGMDDLMHLHLSQSLPMLYEEIDEPWGTEPWLRLADRLHQCQTIDIGPIDGSNEELMKHAGEVFLVLLSQRLVSEIVADRSIVALGDVGACISKKMPSEGTPRPPSLRLLARPDRPIGVEPRFPREDRSHALRSGEQHDDRRIEPSPKLQPKNSLSSRSAESGESLPCTRFSVMISP
jgi:hypothetical protein